MIILTDAQKASDKILQPFMIKAVTKVGIEKNFFNLIRDSYKNLQLTSESIMQDYVFPLRSGSILLLKVLASTIEQEKEIKYTLIENEEVKHFITS